MGGTGSEEAVYEEGLDVPIVGWVGLRRGDPSQFCSLEIFRNSAVWRVSNP